MDVVMNDAATTRWLPLRLRGVFAGVLLASGMTALAAPPQQRAAILLPPVKMEPGELPTLARGAMDDLPGTPIGSTPVARRKGSNDSPAWLSGVDPNVIPASGLIPGRDKAESRTPFLNNAKELPPLTPTKLMSGQMSGQPSNAPAPVRQVDKSRLQPQTSAETQPDPNMPFRGTATNGAPVMAGPPAYRWYGYGAVTPGANAYAPAGQYPKGSANWYGVTGATPGAFPVPVVNPYRSTPGNEPPSYVANPLSRPPMMEQPRSNVVPVPPPVGVRPTPKMHTGISSMPPIESIGTGVPTPQLQLQLPLPKPVGVPMLPTPPKLEPVSVAPPIPIIVPKLEPVAIAPPSIPAKPIIGTPVPAAKPAPDPLPPVLTEDTTWKMLPAVTPPGTWNPATTPPAVPVLPPPDLFLEPGAKLVKSEIVARGQMPETSRPDPAATLIQGVCKGRANGVDVRWNNSKKLTVCFEVRTQPEANKLVKDISARPELAPFAIDFCVLVK